MASKLGGGHPVVLKAKKQIQQLRAGESDLKYRTSEQWHMSNIEAASTDVREGAELAKLEAALKQARCSELGRDHAVVKQGAAKTSQIRRHMFLEALSGIEAEHGQMMQIVAEGGDLSALDEALHVGVNALGYYNPYIQETRKCYKQQRSSWQRQDWEAMVGAHAEAIEHACELGDPELLEACLESAVKSELGKGHRVVLEGKKYLLHLKKDLRRRREESLIEDYEQTFRRLSLEAKFDLEARRADIGLGAWQGAPAPKGVSERRTCAKTWRESLR